MIDVEQELKPFLKVDQMVECLKQKGIKFNFIDEQTAEEYLKFNNNYYNVTSYKYNFEKYTDGENVGKYIDLDFAYLKDMAIIDMHLRTLMFKMTLDIEHYLKMSILNQMEAIAGEDGYIIVNKYLQHDYDNDKRIHSNILKKVGNEHYNKLLNKYNIDTCTNVISDIPIWVFLEIITFGELINFYEYYSKFYNLSENIKKIFILREIVCLRNAVAHNTCILSDIVSINNNYPADNEICKFLSNCNIAKDQRNKRLGNIRLRQIVYTLYMFNLIVTSNGIKDSINDEINDLFYNRILYHCEYYSNNERFKSIYNFFDKIILNIKNNK